VSSDICGQQPATPADLFLNSSHQSLSKPERPPLKAVASQVNHRSLALITLRVGDFGQYCLFVCKWIPNVYEHCTHRTGDRGITGLLMHREVF